MEDRIYTFAESVVYVPNGGYLAPDRIKHYEDCFGKLVSVSYKGRTVVTI